MKWVAVIKNLDGELGIISPQDGEEDILIPIKYLPEGSRVGDILQVKVTFDPYSTLTLIGESRVLDK